MSQKGQMYCFYLHFGFAPLNHGNRFTMFSQLKVGFRNIAVDILTSLNHTQKNKADLTKNKDTFIYI